MNSYELAHYVASKSSEKLTIENLMIYLVIMQLTYYKKYNKQLINDDLIYKYDSLVFRNLSRCIHEENYYDGSEFFVVNKEYVNENIEEKDFIDLLIKHIDIINYILYPHMFLNLFPENYNSNDLPTIELEKFEQKQLENFKDFSNFKVIQGLNW